MLSLEMCVDIVLQTAMDEGMETEHAGYRKEHRQVRLMHILKKLNNCIINSMTVLSNEL